MAIKKREDYESYTASGNVTAAEMQKKAAEDAVSKYGGFNYSKQSDYAKALDEYLNREDFNYDPKEDGLYNLYKQEYTEGGKKAMADTLGKANAMNGGYGTSYGQMAGQQAYGQYMQELSGMIPELYQLARDTYDAESDRLLEKYNLLASDRATEYGEWGDQYNRLLTERDYAANEYDKAYSNDYTAWANDRDYVTSEYWNEYNANYQKERDAASDAQYWASLAEDKRQFDASLAAEVSANSSGYTEQEMQKAANSKATQSFIASIMNKSDLAKRGYTNVDADGNATRYDNHSQYVDDMLENYYKAGKLTENEVAYLKGYYGID